MVENLKGKETGTGEYRGVGIVMWGPIALEYVWGMCNIVI